MQLIGREVPELISNGYIIYLLHGPNALCEAALRICKYRNPGPSFLIPSLIEKLEIGRLHPLLLPVIVNFDASDVGETLIPFVERSIQTLEEQENPGDVIDALIGAVRLVAGGCFPNETAVEVLLWMSEKIYICQGVKGTKIEKLMWKIEPRMRHWFFEFRCRKSRCPW